jgi:hypothetical protein
MILPLLTASAFALRGKEYLSQTKLSLIEARQIALKIYPGKVVTEEIEKETGRQRASLFIRDRKPQS